MKFLGGSSGGDANILGRRTEVPRERKHRNDSCIGITLLANKYLPEKVMSLSKLLPTLQFILLIKNCKPFFCFSLIFWVGVQQQCVLQSYSDLQPHWCPLQEKSPVFLKEFTAIPLLKTMRQMIITICR